MLGKAVGQRLMFRRGKEYGIRWVAGDLFQIQPYQAFMLQVVVPTGLLEDLVFKGAGTRANGIGVQQQQAFRSEEHTSELHHVRISYAVFCLKTKNPAVAMQRLRIDYVAFAEFNDFSFALRLTALLYAPVESHVNCGKLDDIP